MFYFAAILLIIVVTIFPWLGDRLGILAYIINGMEPLMTALGLHNLAPAAFIPEFFWCDYDATDLYDLRSSAQVDEDQLLVASVTPHPRFMVMVKK